MISATILALTVVVLQNNYDNKQPNVNYQKLKVYLTVLSFQKYTQCISVYDPRSC